MSIFKSAIIIFFLLYLPFISFAQNGNSLAGVIKDSSGAALVGAYVTIPDLKTGSVTNASGQYTINDLPKGKYLIQVSMMGFATITKNININGATKLDAILTENIIEKNEVVITGTSRSTEIQRSPTPIKSVSARELRENASTNIIDAISKLPGVSQSATGPAISKPIIRGLGANRVLTIGDGVRQEGQQWGDEHGIEIDDYNVSNIEILKGPASLAYGSDALAGVVNIITTQNIPQNKIIGNITTNYQTNNGAAILHGQLAGNNHGIIWNAFATSKNAHDYKNKYDGYVFNTRYNNMNYGAGIGINKQWGYSKLTYTSFNQFLGIAEGERDSATGKFLQLVEDNGNEEEKIVTDEKSYSMSIPKQQIIHQKLVWDNSFYLKNEGRISAILGYQQNQRKEFEEVADPNLPGLNLRLRTLTYDVKYILPTLHGWNVTTGINGMKQNNLNRGNEFLVPDYDLFDFGAFALANKQWDKLFVAGGIRYDYRNLQAKGLIDEDGYHRFNQFEKNYSNVNGSLGFSYKANKKTILKLNIATGYRAPNIAELSANGTHEGTIRYEYGNTNMTAEKSYQTDLGLEYTSNHIYVSASLFYNYIHNFIYIHKLRGADGNDSIPTENNDAGYAAYQYNQQNAMTYGGEFYLDIHPHPLDWLHFEQTFSYVRGKFANGTDSTQNLPFMPAPRWIITVRAQKRQLNKWMKNSYVKLELNNTFKQSNIFTAYNTETVTPGYSLVNAGLGVDFCNKKQTTICTFTLSVQNIFNTAYQNHLSRLKYAPENLATGRYGIYNMGRNVSVALQFPLSF